MYSWISNLADPLPMSFAGVSRHVGVLEAAGLIDREIRGREHWLSLRGDALESAEQWLHDQRECWASRAEALAGAPRAEGKSLNPEETREVVVERVLPACPGAVFHEWTDAESFAEWMCPRPARATRVELDARVGGAL